ncbi:MAG: hypothetical protein F6K54_29910 [Okeania sp. SIO3B5]|uniref:hypothetical protein n=1 Tax=Okeania sp. SIO3B5 TaxID=2607811 RepID=UPI00140158BA|nr:hypothetical protein [Okeania sp. SIO3B5]NEO56918.1 hypothetical protein [Okeania sp. SIO3B5]
MSPGAGTGAGGTVGEDEALGVVGTAGESVVDEVARTGAGGTVGEDEALGVAGTAGESVADGVVETDGFDFLGVIE